MNNMNNTLMLYCMEGRTIFNWFEIITVISLLLISHNKHNDCIFVNACCETQNNFIIILLSYYQRIFMIPARRRNDLASLNSSLGHITLLCITL